jgi:23S rRNA (adenine2030-N6)-methyltransferase
MNYRHIYHAGNFADVIKHLLLIQVIERLKLKETPFFVLDTHAGIGLYNLSSEQAQKTKEANSGIMALLETELENQDLINYINIIRSFNTDGTLTVYPGSPAITSNLMRSQDRLLANELHPDDYNALVENSKHMQNRIRKINMDAYQALQANIPPKERRGLVLIDPPFEEKNEFEVLAKQIENALKRWGTGTYVIWFPLKAHLPIEKFYANIKVLNVPKTLLVECWIDQKNAPGLSGCGMIVLNTPWLVDERMGQMAGELQKYICPAGAPGIEIRWLVEGSNG